MPLLPMQSDLESGTAKCTQLLLDLTLLWRRSDANTAGDNRTTLHWPLRVVVRAPCFDDCLRFGYPSRFQMESDPESQYDRFKRARRRPDSSGTPYPDALTVRPGFFLFHARLSSSARFVRNPQYTRTAWSCHPNPVGVACPPMLATL